MQLAVSPEATQATILAHLSYLLPPNTHRHLLLEYNDTLNRSRRLSQAVDAVLAEKAPPTNIISVEDVTIYLRWLVFHHTTTKCTAAFIQVFDRIVVMDTGTIITPCALAQQRGRVIVLSVSRFVCL